MKVALSWIKDYIDLSDVSVEEISSMITLCGAEVEGVEKVGGDINGVVVGEIHTIEKHPNADKLSVCKVDLGSMGDKTIVCGAKNISEGNLVPVATLGTKLPNEMEIKRTKIRGLESEGMICAKSELGLEDESEGVWLLDESYKPGDRIGSVLGAEDYVLDIDITANRGDLLSVVGLCRELGAAFNRRPVFKEAESYENIGGNLDISVENEEGCPRYTARAIKNVKIGPSPAWLARRLEMAGLRSINNVVDVTNYVLLEYGQPLHAFDYNKLTDKKITVRSAQKGESITVIDGSEHELDEDILVIADGAGPVAAAGVMGGQDTEVDDKTTDLLIESAYFDPVRIRLGSKKLGLKSDSSYRFERGIDPTTTIDALNRCVELIVNTAGGEPASKIKEISSNLPARRTIVFHLESVEKRLGVKLEKSVVLDIFRRLNFKVNSVGNDTFNVEVPGSRNDLNIEVDLIEEIARIYGYNEIPLRLPKIVSNPVETDYYEISSLKHTLASYGLNQSVNFSMAESALYEKLGFNPETFIHIKHPISKELDILRPNVFVDLMRTLKNNKNRGKSGAEFFEIGNIFYKENGEYIEERKAAAVLYGEKRAKSWNGEALLYDFYDASGIVEELLTNYYKVKDFRIEESNTKIFMPTANAAVFAEGKEIGRLGEVHRRVMDFFGLPGKAFVICMDLDPLIQLQRGAKRYENAFRFPPVYRDLALVMKEEQSFGAILKCIRGFDEKIANVDVVDVYRGGQIGENEKSVAVSLVYNDPQRTLNESEVEEIEKRLLKELAERFSLKLRS